MSPVLVSDISSLEKYLSVEMRYFSFGSFDYGKTFLTNDLKERVRSFWDNVPCGTRGVLAENETSLFFERIEVERDRLEPFIPSFAAFESHRGERVLEVGFGAGTDFVRFARAGVNLFGIDFSHQATRLARRRLEYEKLPGSIVQADAECLPFMSGVFDFVYSWGVIHHTPDTERAAGEIVRVCKPGGSVCVMIYHRYSQVALQCWLLYALGKGRPWRSISRVIANHVESPGTKAYTKKEVRSLFGALEELVITSVVTPYDFRLTRSRLLPAWVRKMIPAGVGWFLVVRGTKGSVMP